MSVKEEGRFLAYFCDWFKELLLSLKAVAECRLISMVTENKSAYKCVWHLLNFSFTLVTVMWCESSGSDPQRPINAMPFLPRSILNRSHRKIHTKSMTLEWTWILQKMIIIVHIPPPPPSLPGICITNFDVPDQKSFELSFIYLPSSFAMFIQFASVAAFMLKLYLQFYWLF